MKNCVENGKVQRFNKLTSRGGYNVLLLFMSSFEGGGCCCFCYMPCNNICNDINKVLSSLHL